jgi:hypothetical protein
MEPIRTMLRGEALPKEGVMSRIERPIRLYLAMGLLVAAILITIAPARAAWFFDERLTDDPAASFTSMNNACCTCVDAGGRIHVVWYDLRTGTAAVYHKFLDGTVWSPDIMISSSTSSAQYPAIAADGTGAVHVVWTDFRDGNYEVYCRRYDGTSWSSEVRLTTDSGVSFNPSIAADDSGNVYVVWIDSRDGNSEVYFKAFEAGTWSPDVRLTNNAALSQYPSVCKDGNSDLHVVWQDNRDGNTEIYYKKYEAPAWGADTRLTSDPGNSERPSVGVDTGGRVHVVWQDDRDGNYEIYHKLHNGSAWGADVRVTTAPGSSCGPFITPDDSMNIHLVWYDNRNGTNEIYYNKYVGTSWYYDRRLTDAEGNSLNPSLAANPAGDLSLVWQDNRDGNYEIYRKWYSNIPLPPPTVTSIVPSSGISDEIVDITEVSGSNFVEGADVVLHMAGEPDVVAEDVIVESPSGITCRLALYNASPGYWDVVVRNPDGQFGELASGFWVLPSVWYAEERLTHQSDESNTSKSNVRCVTADSQGNVHMVWFDERDGGREIYYKKHSGDSWGPDTRISSSGDAAEYPAICADTADRIHVVWSDHRDGEWEIYCRCNDGSGWGAEQRLDSGGGWTQFPSIAADDLGGVHLVWQDYVERVHGVWYSFFDGAAWQEAECVANIEDYYDGATPAVAVDGDSRIYVVWRGGRTEDCSVKYVMSEGISWGEPQLISTAENIGAPAIAVDPNNTVHVVWHDERYGSRELIHKAYDGAVWTPDEVISDLDGYDSETPSITFDSQGDLYLVWSDSKDLNKEIYFMLREGTQWGDKLRLTYAAQESKFPSCVLDNDRRLHVVWMDNRDINFEIYYRLRDPGVLSEVEMDLAQPFRAATVTVSPNPLRDGTRIGFNLETSEDVNISIYELSGRLVWSRRVGMLSSGQHQIAWDGSGPSGKPVAPGIYFVRVGLPDRRESAKIIVLK